MIIDGRTTRETLMPELARRVKGLSFTPTLAIIQVGERADSTSYIKGKTAFAQKIGVTVRHIKLAETVSQGELVAEVLKCNEDKSVHGIIVQLPLPIALDKEAVIAAINPKKDVDGLTPINAQLLSEGSDKAVMPATARGVKELLNHYTIPLFNKRVTVVGRSALVGKPIAMMCEAENAQVTVCHSKTVDLAAETKTADILIVAAGKPKLIGPAHVSTGQTVIDVGINPAAEDDESGKTVVGDVDFEAVKDIVASISPVPGGVGPMTVLALFENLIDLCP